MCSCCNFFTNALSREASACMSLPPLQPVCALPLMLPRVLLAWCLLAPGTYVICRDRPFAEEVSLAKYKVSQALIPKQICHAYLANYVMRSYRMLETCYREWRRSARFSEDISQLGVTFLSDLGCFQKCAACSGARLRSSAGRAAAACTPPEATGNAAGDEAVSTGAEAQQSRGDVSPSAQHGGEGAPPERASAAGNAAGSQQPAASPLPAWVPGATGVDI